MQQPLPPFLAAAAAGDLATLRQLIAQGEDVNQVDSKGQTAAFVALHNAESDTIKYLVQQNLFDINKKYCGMTLLLAAGIEGFTDVVDFLLEKNANVTLPSEKTGTSILIVEAARIDCNCNRIKKILELGGTPFLHEYAQDLTAFLKRNAERSSPVKAEEIRKLLSEIQNTPTP